MIANGIQRLGWMLSICVLAACTGTTAFAQSTTGSIYGTVTDSTSAVIPNATITVTNLETNQIYRATSNGSGNYVFPSLSPGTYKISAQMTSFRGETQTGLHLDANQNVQASFSLVAGAKEQSITVEATNTLIDTRSSQLATTVDQRRLEELPLNGRDAYDLVNLSPNVTNYVQANGGSQVGDNVGATFSVNGLHAYNNSYYLDGASDTTFFRQGGNYSPNPDALQEFRLLTSNFDAEFGAMPGGVVNFITRSGSNSFHGLAYDYLRNNILNAKNYFNTVVTPLKQNQFGGNFGGPILHNKLFFFADYQGLRIHTSSLIAPSAITVPTTAERTGNFSADSTIPKCTGTSSANTTTYPCGGPAGVIPAQYLDPVAVNVLNSIPVATSFNGKSGGPGPQQNAVANVSANQYLGRGDYQLNSKHLLSAMYFNEKGQQQNPTAGGANIIGWSGNLIEDTVTNTVGTDTWTISANALNTFRLYYTGNHYAAADLYSGKNSLASLGAAIPDGATPSTQPNFRVTGFFTMGNSGSAPNSYTQTAFGGGDTLNWTRGNHTIKAGWTFQWNKYYLNTVGQRAGIYTVNGATSGNSLADFELGKASIFNQNNGFVVNLHQPDPAIFAQDDWRATRRLTLNLGIRWELFPPFTGGNKQGTFIPNVQSTRFPTAPLGVLSAGDPGVPDGILQTTWNRFSPRVGLAYDVFGDGRTSFRMGYGIFYSGISASFYSSLVGPLYAASVTLNSAKNFVNPYTSVNATDPFPYTPNLANPVFAPGLTFAGMTPYNKAVPYVQEYNVTLEQQFGSNWGFHLSYVGNAARKFYTQRDENAPIYSPTGSASAASILARRPYKPAGVSYVFNGIDQLAPIASSSYNSLQTSITRRFTHGFSFTGSYVWAKTMTNSADPTPNPITMFTNTNSYNFAQDWGKATSYAPQRFVASYLYAIPGVHRWGFIGTQILSGWQVNGITTLSTGSPFNVLSGVDSNFDGVATDRPNVVGNPIIGGSRTRTAKIAGFFNTTAFAQVPAGTPYGNEQMNMLVGPGYINTDFSAFKIFPLWKEHTLQFRGEVFNVFNNINLGNPGATLSNAATFGKITSEAGGNRVVQFALRYSF